MRIHRILGVVALVVVSALALAACGSSGYSGRLIVPAPATAKEFSAAELEASAKEAVGRCKLAVTNAHALAAAARSELKVFCNKVVAVSGTSAESLRHFICSEVANDSASAEATRERALKTCEREAS